MCPEAVLLGHQKAKDKPDHIAQPTAGPSDKFCQNLDPWGLGAVALRLPRLSVSLCLSGLRKKTVDRRAKPHRSKRMRGRARFGTAKRKPWPPNTGRPAPRSRAHLPAMHHTPIFRDESGDELETLRIDTPEPYRWPDRAVQVLERLLAMASKR